MDTNDPKPLEDPSHPPPTTPQRLPMMVMRPTNNIAGLADSREKGPPESHLAAFAGADTIVVPWGLVLAHKAGLVDTRWGRWRWRTGYHLLWAGALCLHRYRRKRAEHMSMSYVTNRCTAAMMCSFQYMKHDDCLQLLSWKASAISVLEDWFVKPTRNLRGKKMDG